jgi:hypothetical protein
MLEWSIREAERWTGANLAGVIVLVGAVIALVLWWLFRVTSRR